MKTRLEKEKRAEEREAFKKFEELARKLIKASEPITKRYEKRREATVRTSKAA